MGFLSQLADSFSGTAFGAITEGISNLFGSSSSNPYDGRYKGSPLTHVDINAYSKTGVSDPWINVYSDIASKGTHSGLPVVSDDEWTTGRNPGMVALKGKVDKKEGFASEKFEVVDTQYGNSGYNLRVPTWGYDSFIHERAVWQKGLQSPFGEPGYFYFKLFFDFDTQYGLFGGVLNNNDSVLPTNAAFKYLKLLEEQSSTYKNYSNCLLAQRQKTLDRFVKTLSYINTAAPWFFIGIRGLDQASNPIQKEYSKERFIEIECAPEAIDMRLTTLLDLYNFTCYDSINGREIIPENLRKFDLNIMLYNTPIRHLHTPAGNGKMLGYKRLEKIINVDNGGQNMPTFKMFSFYNCEIVTESLGSSVPAQISNENPFQMGKNVIKIKYDTCMTYNMNEFNSFMFGTDGIYIDNYVDYQLNNNDKRFQSNFMGPPRNVAVSRFISSVTSSLGLPNFTSLGSNSDITFEQYAQNNLSMLSTVGFGNLYRDKATKTNSNYWKAKVKWWSQKPNHGLDIEPGFVGRALGAHSGDRLGSLPGYRERGVGSEYWKKKIQNLKNGNKSGQKFIMGAENFQVGSEYWKNKVKKLKNGSNKIITNNETPVINRQDISKLTEQKSKNNIQDSLTNFGGNLKNKLKRPINLNMSDQSYLAQ